MTVQALYVATGVSYALPVPAPGVPPADPLTAAKVGQALIGVAANLLPGAARTLKQTVEAHRQIGEVMPVALGRMLCESEAGAEGVAHAVKVTAAQLVRTEVPSQVEPARLKQIGGAMLRFMLLRRTPPATPYAKRLFDELLSEWIEKTLEEPEVKAAIQQVRCPDGAFDTATLRVRFPNAFFVALHDASPTRWRNELLRSIIEAEEAEEKLRRRRKRADQVLRSAAAAAAAGGAVGGASALLGWETPPSLAAGIAAASAALITAAQGLRPES